MSMTLEEAAFEEWQETFISEVISQSLADTLPSCYRENIEIAVPAYNALTEARSLLPAHPAAALVLAVTAIEQAIKKVFLEPLVRGLIHESAQGIAPLIASKTIGHRGWGQFEKLLFTMLDEHGGIDLKTYRRDGSTESLWKEAQNLRDMRNRVVHQGQLGFDPDSSIQAVAVAAELLEKLFPALIARLDGYMHVHRDLRLCTDYRCSEGIDK